MATWQRPLRAATGREQEEPDRQEEQHNSRACMVREELSQ